MEKDKGTLLPMGKMVPASNLESSMIGLGFERVQGIHGSTYKENSTVVIAPTRGTIHHKVVSAWQGLIAPMNQKRAFLFAAGHEVGQAYNALIKSILDDPNLSQWKYILTLEDDNLPPPDAHIRLLETIDKGYDAVGGLYFTKGDINMPMAYGDPGRFRATGQLDFIPRNVVDLVNGGGHLEVNGIAMGCTLWKMDLFREIEAPWFVTVNDVVQGEGVKCYTQDLYFCERARRAGKRFAVDCRVKVGHLDGENNVVY